MKKHLTKFPGIKLFLLSSLVGCATLSSESRASSVETTFCDKKLEARLRKQILPARKLSACANSADFLPQKLGGARQAIIVADGEEGLAILIYPLVMDSGTWLPASRPLFEFTGLGEKLLPMKNSSGKELELFYEDLDGDGRLEFGILGFAQPNASLVLKRFNSEKGHFEDAYFKVKSKGGAEVPIVVSLDERLHLPKSLKEAFEVRDLKGKVLRSYVFSRSAD